MWNLGIGVIKFVPQGLVENALQKLQLRMYLLTNDLNLRFANSL